MKKFLIFLVAIVVVVTLGLTTYYFLRNEETIDFTVKEIYCNLGDVVTVEDLGKVVKKENKSNRTVYDYNAGGEEVTSKVEFLPEQGYYVAKAGGNPVVVITTTNSRCPEFKIAFHIGDGTGDTPYFINNQAGLMKIGNTEGGYGLNSNYSLTSDIILSEDFKPIGYNAATGTTADFTGTFNGNGHTISGLKLTSDSQSVVQTGFMFEAPQTNSIVDAGFFTSLSETAVVSNIKLDDVTISGSFETTGALAGKGAGKIRNIAVTNANITNTCVCGFTGGIFGTFTDVASIISVSSVDSTTLTIGKEGVSMQDGTCVGGLVGKVDKAKVHATYARTVINCINDTTNAAHVGGLAGEFKISAVAGTIQESYAICSSEYGNCGAFIGTISQEGAFIEGQFNILKYLVGNYCATATRNAIISMPDIFKAELFTRTDVFLIDTKATTESDFKANGVYYYYSVGPDKHVWDSSVWEIEANALPQLKFNNIALEEVNTAYYLKDLNDKPIDDKNEFLELIRDALDNHDGVLSGSYSINTDVDLTEYGTWKPVALKNCVLNFGGNGETVVPHTIRHLILGNAVDGNMGLFSTMENSAVLNLNLEDVQIAANASRVGAVAGTIVKTSDTSLISNVKVSYATPITDKTMDYFGGLVAYADAITIENCSVEGINTVNSSVKYAGGVAGKLASGTIAGVHVDITSISGTEAVAGLVAINGGRIQAYEYTTETTSGIVNNHGTVIINYEGKQVARVGGLVGENSGDILNGKFDVIINVKSTLIADIKEITHSFNSIKLANIEALNTLKVGGVAGVNTNNIENVTITGSGISVVDAIGNSIIIGGLVAVNNGSLKSCACNLAKVGSYYVNKTFVVGGIAGINSADKSEIEQCSVSADLEGNYVSGVVVSMNNSNATVKQVFVGKISTDDGFAFVANTMSGDKYVAGICYNLNAGKMEDIQTISKIEGKTNYTRSSLAVLLFPNTASLIRASVNSYCDGYGVFYRDTWKDFTTSGDSDHYNLYGVDAACGSMQQVVYNGNTMATAGKSYIVSKFRVDFWIGVTTLTYQNTSRSSYVRQLSASEFNKTSNYTSNFTITPSNADLDSGYILIPASYTKSMNFDFNNVWAYNGSIVLAFMITE